MNPALFTARYCWFAVILVGALLSSSVALAQPPAGYYDSVDTTNAATLRVTLHEVIDDHTRFPYTASTTDTWDILNLADEDPNNTNNIIDLYKNASYGKIAGGSGAYNREHSWPKSYGFPDRTDDNYAYTDTHHLFACDVSYNSDRGNKPFGTCDSSCTERSTLFNDGRGGGSGTHPGNSNWFDDTSSIGTFEAWNGRKGDVARAILYMDIRYEGGSHGVTGFSEPDLIATNNTALISSSATGNNESVAYMGLLSVLLQWHAQDPPDSREMWRNEVIYSFQGNRNPFIDHPEWVACLHNGICDADTTSPAAPTGLIASAGAGEVSLDWLANGEPDLAGYNVYRATNSGGPYSQRNSGLVGLTTYSDSPVSTGTTYFYVVRAVDVSGNESGNSNEVSAVPTSPPSGSGLLLSEVLYDVAGSDNGREWVEIFNPGSSAVDLSGFCLGNGGTTYTSSTAQLSGTIGAGAVFVVGGPTSTSSNSNPTFDQVLNFNPDLQNSGSTADGVALFDVPCAQVSSSTVPMDAVVYGSSNRSGLIDETGSARAPEVGDASSGSSIERVDLAGSWSIQRSPTPNSTPLGSPPPPATSGDLLLSEVFYDSAGSDSGYEWVELYNNDTVAIDLSAFSLGNGGSNYAFSVVQLSGIIQPGAVFVVGGPNSNGNNGNPVFQQSVDFNPDFQNSGSKGDGVALFNLAASAITAASLPIDAVVYGSNNSNGLIDETGSARAPEVGDAPSGSSLERTNLAGSWRIQSNPNPNQTPLAAP